MTYKPVRVAAFLALLPLASPAFAVDLENTDDQDYEVTIVSSDGRENATFILQGGTTEENVCTACLIRIDGVGEIEAREGDNFEIAGGQLTNKSD